MNSLYLSTGPLNMYLGMSTGSYCPILLSEDSRDYCQVCLPNLSDVQFLRKVSYEKQLKSRLVDVT